MNDERNRDIRNIGRNPNGGAIYIGNNVDIGWDCVVDTSGGIKIGDRVNIGRGTMIYTHHHNIDDINWMEEKNITYIPLVIRENVFIGAGCIILPQVVFIGKGAIIGAGSVVTKSVPRYEVWAGNPARFMRKRRVEYQETYEDTGEIIK